ncbi:MAG TPA: hypothetical protein ENK57_08955 [Polyangiaceae bacterium]|nr:hypothetical protein [Polyangiaceae bacterium]
MSFADYVRLLRWTGRAVLAGKGQITGAPPSAITRLSIEPDAWLRTMSEHGLSRAGALGCIEELSALAKRRETRWVRGAGLARKLFAAA